MICRNYLGLFARVGSKVWMLILYFIAPIVISSPLILKNIILLSGSTKKNVHLHRCMCRNTYIHCLCGDDEECNCIQILTLFIRAFDWYVIKVHYVDLSTIEIPSPVSKMVLGNNILFFLNYPYLCHWLTCILLKLTRFSLLLTKIIKTTPRSATNASVLLLVKYYAYIVFQTFSDSFCYDWYEVS